jgi:nucleotide-binding universal stress UspA family protein
MFSHIVVIVDGSPTSQYAIGASLTVARAIGSQLHFYLSVDPELTADGVGMLSMAQMAEELKRKQLDDALARAAQAGIHGATGSIRVGDPAKGVIQTARDRDADLIMLGAAPLVGLLRPFIRTLANTVLQETTIPLCVLRRPARGYLSHRIIVPIVDDALADLAISEAITIARQFGSTLIFCSVATSSGAVVAEDAVQRALRIAAAHGIPAEELVVPPAGGVTKAIVRNADLQGCDLIVMATHVRRGLPRLIEGSITEAVVATSDVPVVIVRNAHPSA